MSRRPCVLSQLVAEGDAATAIAAGEELLELFPLESELVEVKSDRSFHGTASFPLLKESLG